MTTVDMNVGSSALLVMDCQVYIVNMLTHSEKDKVLSNLSRCIVAARKAGIPVIYVVVQFRKGYPEVSSNNVLFSGLKEAGQLLELDPHAQICEEIGPETGEVIITKKRIAAFTGSDLDVVLRSRRVDTLVLTGVSSLGVVESTARFAFDMDYRIFVIGDCCSDQDPEANRIAVTHVLPRISTLLSTDEFISAISE